jgi:hypothetical protein
MKSKQGVRLFVGGIAVILCLAVSPRAWAEKCFTSFSGTVHIQLETTTAALQAQGTQSFGGRIFGSLSPCAGLNQWPVIATKVTKGTQVILAFRAMTVDAASCGAVDEIAKLASGTLSGPLQLHNDRNNFSNTSTLVPAACTNPAAAAALAAPAGKDKQGNVVPK